MIGRYGSVRIPALILAAMLLMSFPAPVNAAVEDHWYDSISEMLSAGQYEEGVVIAGIDMSAAKRPGDPGSALETKKLRSAADEIMTVDPGAAEQQDFFTWLLQLKNRLTGQYDDSVCITCIRRSDMTTAQILRMLASDDSVLFAEPNYIKNLETIGDNDNGNEQGNAAAAGEAKDASALQWSSSENVTLHAAGKTGDAEVSMKIPGWPDGLNMDNEIIVAVVDMPVDFTNPDLQNVAYKFSPEMQAELGCDVHGYNGMWECNDGQLDYNGAGSHGTHIAGIIGAEWDNRGISGVGSKVKIVSVQNSKSGMTSLIDSLNGYSFIKNAVEKDIKIRIVNNSWGLQQSSKALDAAVTELGKHGVVSFFSAGNDGNDLNALSNLGSMLGNNPYAIIVASTKPDGTISDFSSYGRGIVTLGAPGECILSCIRPAEAEYMPVLSENNKVYEDFENYDEKKLKLCQVGYKEDGSPDPTDVVSGTGGSVVTGTDVPGFEGQKVLKIRFDRSRTYITEDGETMLALKLDLDKAGKTFTAGDGVGFAFGGEGCFFPVSMEVAGVPESRTVNKYKYYNYPGSWGSYSYTLKDDISTGASCSFICQIIVPEDEDEVYLDAIGISAERQPYAFMSGTSMAAPAAAGAAAVIASRHHDELNVMGSDSAKKLANLVRSSVRPNASLAGKTSTGGIIDLTVDENKTSPAETPGPDIADLTVSGKTVTLSGAYFGETEGTVNVSKYVLGAPSDVGSSIVSWRGSRVVLTLDNDFEGIIEAVLTASNGKKDTVIKYISRSGNIFEKDHHIGSETGEPFEFNEPGSSDPETFGDYETSAVLVAGDGRLWYLPKTAKVEENAACKSMYSYDPDSESWSACPSLPEWIRIVSGTWFDGRIYVKGTIVCVDESGTIPYSNPDGTPYDTCVYSYKPGDSSWTKCSTNGVGLELTLFAADGRLMLAGATIEESKDKSAGRYPSVREYDPSSGAGQPLGYIPCSAIKPKAAYAGGHVYLFVTDFTTERCKLFVLDGSMSAGNEDVIELPEFYTGDEYGNRLREYDSALLSYGEMLILTGPAAKNGSSDTFMLREGENSLKPFSRRVSDAKVHMPAAAVLDGRLYVIAASLFEPDMRIFRSNELPGPDTERFTITYDLNGGSFDGSTKAIKEVYKKGTVISVHEAPKREGYAFRYWKGSKYYPGDKYTVTEDHTFTAHWGKKAAGGARTGDGSHPAVWAALALLAAVGIAVMAFLRRNR